MEKEATYQEACEAKKVILNYLKERMNDYQDVITAKSDNREKEAILYLILNLDYLLD